MSKKNTVFTRAYGFTAHQLKDMLNMTYYKVYKAHRDGKLAQIVDELLAQVRRDRMDTDQIGEEENG